MVLGMHTFPSYEPLTESLAKRMGIPEVNIYSPGQMVQNVVSSMGFPTLLAGQNIGFIVEAMTWLTVVLMTGWLDKFPRLTAAILESNATWLPMVLEKAETYLEVHGNHKEFGIGSPEEAFYRQCFIAFEGDEDPVYRMSEIYENVGLWSSDYPHDDGANAWEAIARMNKWKVPQDVQAKLLGGNARRMCGIRPC